MLQSAVYPFSALYSLSDDMKGMVNPERQVVNDDKFIKRNKCSIL